MARKRIYSERLTGAEKQRRYREKQNEEYGRTEEQEHRENERIRRELHNMIDNLYAKELCVIRPLMKALYMTVKQVSEREIEHLSSFLADIPQEYLETAIADANNFSFDD